MGRMLGRRMGLRLQSELLPLCILSSADPFVFVKKCLTNLRTLHTFFSSNSVHRARTNVEARKEKVKEATAVVAAVRHSGVAEEIVASARDNAAYRDYRSLVYNDEKFGDGRLGREMFFTSPELFVIVYVGPWVLGIDYTDGCMKFKEGRRVLGMILSNILLLFEYAENAFRTDVAAGLKDVRDPLPTMRSGLRFELSGVPVGYHPDSRSSKTVSAGPDGQAFAFTPTRGTIGVYNDFWVPISARILEFTKESLDRLDLELPGQSVRGAEDEDLWALSVSTVKEMVLRIFDGCALMLAVLLPILDKPAEERSVDERIQFLALATGGLRGQLVVYVSCFYLGDVVCYGIGSSHTPAFMTEEILERFWRLVRMVQKYWGPVAAKCFVQKFIFGQISGDGCIGFPRWNGSCTISLAINRHEILERLHRELYSFGFGLVSSVKIYYPLKNPTKAIVYVGARGSRLTIARCFEALGEPSWCMVVSKSDRLALLLAVDREVGTSSQARVVEEVELDSEWEAEVAAEARLEKLDAAYIFDE